LLKRELEQFAKDFDITRLLFCEHHLSHAASAFYPSPFEDAAVLTMDGVGEWATTSAAMGSGKNLEVFQEIHFPHSLGLLYSAFVLWVMSLICSRSATVCFKNLSRTINYDKITVLHSNWTRRRTSRSDCAHALEY
jgi:hypothetical protein